MEQKHRLAKIISFLIPVAFLAVSVFGEVLQEITVKEGDTLWSVANYYLKDPQRWPEILKHNKLPSSDLNVILPGMRIRVPMLLIKEHLRAAHLVFIYNDVRYRRKAEAEWKQPWQDMELFNEDGLRTLQQSQAKVKFPSGELLNMDENSLIILKPEKKQEEIDLLSGGVRASRTKILTSSSIVDPKISPKGPAPDFKTRLKEDKTTLVEVYEGIVDVTAQGKTVTLTKGFGTEVKFRQPPSVPRSLPPAPILGSELNNSGSTAVGIKQQAPQKVVYNSLQMDIHVPQYSAASPSSSSSSPSTSSGAENKHEPQSQVVGQMVNKYHVQLSTAFSFSSIILEETKPLQDKINLDLAKEQLGDGIYYYRYAYVDDLGFEGQFSYPTQFVIDTMAPVLEIDTPRDGDEYDTEFVSIEGRTEPNIVIKINDKTATSDDKGNFVSAIMPKKGKNLISLFAQDRAGNTTKKEIVVEKVKTARQNKTEAVKTAKEKSGSLLSLSLGTLTLVVIVGVILLFVK